MKHLVLLLILIGSGNAAFSQTKLQTEQSLKENTTLQQSVRYSSLAVVMTSDSTKNGKAAVDNEPSPDDFIPTEIAPEPNYAELQRFLKYPDSAVVMGLEGKVIVRVLVGKDGRVKPGRARIEDTSNEIFNKPSIDAVMKTSFSPAIQKGQPIEVWITVPILFKLRTK